MSTNTETRTRRILPRPTPGERFNDAIFVLEFSKKHKNGSSSGTNRIGLFKCRCGQIFAREMKLIYSGKATTNCGCRTYEDYVSIPAIRRMAGELD